MDGSAEVENRYIYNAFGHIQAELSTVTNHHTWVGKFGYQDDSQNDLYFADARYYAAATGRFLTPDPEGTTPDPNVYRYAGNNPVNRVDPSGRAESAEESQDSPKHTDPEDIPFLIDQR